MVTVSWLCKRTNTILNFWNKPCSRYQIEKIFRLCESKTEDNFWPKMDENGYVNILKYARSTCRYDSPTMRFASMVIFCVSRGCVSLSVQSRVEEWLSDNTHSLHHTVPLTNRRYASHFMSPFPIKLLFSPQTWSKDSWMMVLYCCLRKCVKTSKNRSKSCVKIGG